MHYVLCKLLRLILVLLLVAALMNVSARFLIGRATRGPRGMR